MHILSILYLYILYMECIFSTVKILKKWKKKKICWRYPEWACLASLVFSSYQTIRDCTVHHLRLTRLFSIKALREAGSLMTWCFFCMCVCQSGARRLLKHFSLRVETEITPTGQTKGTQTRSIAKHPSLQPELALPAQLIQSDDLTSTLPTSPTNTHKHCALALQLYTIALCNLNQHINQGFLAPSSKKDVNVIACIRPLQVNFRTFLVLYLPD